MQQCHSSSLSLSLSLRRPARMHLQGLDGQRVIAFPGRTALNVEPHRALRWFPADAWAVQEADGLHRRCRRVPSPGSQQRGAAHLRGRQLRVWASPSRRRAAPLLRGRQPTVLLTGRLLWRGHRLPAPRPRRRHGAAELRGRRPRAPRRDRRTADDVEDVAAGRRGQHVRNRVLVNCQDDGSVRGPLWQALRLLAGPVRGVHPDQALQGLGFDAHRAVADATAGAIGEHRAVALERQHVAVEVAEREQPQGVARQEERDNDGANGLAHRASACGRLVQRRLRKAVQRRSAASGHADPVCDEGRGGGAERGESHAEVATLESIPLVAQDRHDRGPHRSTPRHLDADGD
mmetsp:Transcript_61222/g.155509  ORF Transcript_61222/g.155509 Transcript_61222/m.155509 type:complete len:347 (-) Transcript_61222:22-1062(-)